MADEMSLYEGDIDDTTEGWVTTLQLALTRAGHEPQGGADGKFGWRTKAALVAFQQAMALSDQGGVAGNQTWAALMGRDAEPPGTNNGPHGGLYRARQQQAAPVDTESTTIPEDGTALVGQVTDYHIDSELVTMIDGKPFVDDIDAAFETQYGSSYITALTGKPRDAEWPRVWLDLLQQRAQWEGDARRDEASKTGAFWSEDFIRDMVGRVKPGSEQEMVDWSKAQIAAWEDALTRSKFATADRLQHEYQTALGAWQSHDVPPGF